MAIINGKALVKDGKPLDRVYSNGQLVYGRNLLSGTKDFSGIWENSSSSETDGTYKGLTVKKKTAQWNGINKSLTIQTSNYYTFSAFVKGTGTGTAFSRYVFINGIENKTLRRAWDSAFDWTRDSVTLTPTNIKQGDVVAVRYDISALGTNPAVWTAGHKWEFGSIATPWTPAPEDYI